MRALVARGCVDCEAANVTGTRHVISAAITAGVRRLVHISSPAVIFAGRDQYAVGDDAPYFGRHFSEYARTKQLAEPLAPAMGSESLRSPWGQSRWTNRGVARGIDHGV